MTFKLSSIGRRVKIQRVPCPYFEPQTKSRRAVAFRLPLRAFWLGRCTAGGTPDEDTQLEHCNLGYALPCPHLPPDREADAVRFSERPDGPMFILEKDHRPVRWDGLATIEPGTVLSTQAQAWLKR